MQSGHVDYSRRCVVRAFAQIVLFAIVVTPGFACCAEVALAWSAPAVLTSAGEDPLLQAQLGQAPAIVVNARGAAVVAWATNAEPPEIRVARAPRRGRFGRAVTVGHGIGPAAILFPGGTTFIAWTDGRWVRYARASAGGRFSRPRPLVTPSVGDGLLGLAPQRDGAIVAIYAHDYQASGRERSRLRAVRVSPAGRPGRVRDLGIGSLSAGRIRPTGDAAVCCVDVPRADGARTGPFGPRQVAIYTPHHGWSSVTAALAPRALIQTITPVPGEPSAVLGVIDVRHLGDAGARGQPGIQRIGRDAGPFFPAPTDRPSYAFGPVVTLGGDGRSALLYQERRERDPFAMTGPLYAAVPSLLGAFDRRQLLDPGRASNPRLTTYDRGALAMWQQQTGTLGAAVSQRGVFRRVAAPRVGPVAGDSHTTLIGVSSVGRCAGVVWLDGRGGIHASIATELAREA